MKTRLRDLLFNIRSSSQNKIAIQVLNDRGLNIDSLSRYFDDTELSQDDIECVLEALCPDCGIIRDFLGSISVLIKASDILSIRATGLNPLLFTKSMNVGSCNLLTVDRFDWCDHIPNKKFDLMVCDFPLNSNRCKTDVLQSLSYLDDKGYAFYILGPSAMSGKKGDSFKKDLSDKGFYINAVFNTTEDVGVTGAVTPIFVAISKKQTDYLFVAELNDPNQAKDISETFISGADNDNLNQGMRIPCDVFDNFPALEARNEIAKIETFYKDFKQVSFKDIVIEINRVKTGGKFKEINNSIYIPSIGKSPVVPVLSKTTIKHQNYHQVVLNETALNSYVSTFFQSDIGRLTLDAVTLGGTIKHISQGNLYNIVIAMPEMDIQQKIAQNIVETENKILELQEAIRMFNKEVVLNPTSSEQFLHKIDEMLNLVGLLTESDEIKRIIRSGESDTVEFKQTLDFDIKTKQKEKYIQTSALKTIPGFMNNKGGVLLIGVADNGSITGLEGELKKLHKDSIDNFKLHFKNILRTRIGEKFYPFIDYEVHSVDGKLILKVNCKQIIEGKGCYLDGEAFYVRRNPGTDKLEGQQLVDYTISHFKN